MVKTSSRTIHGRSNSTSCALFCLWAFHSFSRNARSSDSSPTRCRLSGLSFQFSKTRGILVEQLLEGAADPGGNVNPVGDPSDLLLVAGELDLGHLFMFLGDRVDVLAGIHRQDRQIDSGRMVILTEASRDLELLFGQHLGQLVDRQPVVPGLDRGVAGVREPVGQRGDLRRALPFRHLHEGEGGVPFVQVMDVDRIAERLEGPHPAHPQDLPLDDLPPDRWSSR